MTILMYSFIAITILLWFAALLHLYQNQTIYRPFDWPVWAVKGFWVLLLLTFSPWAFAAFFIWGFWIKPSETRGPKAHAAHLLLLLAVASLALPFQWSHSASQSISYTKDSQGEWQANSDANLSNTSLHAGTIQTNSNTSSSSSVSAGSDAHLALGRIALVLKNEHPLLIATGQQLVENIKTVPHVQQVDWLPKLENATLEGPLPDIWIRLELTGLTERRLGPNLSLEAEIRLSASPTLFGSGHSYHETYSPPLVTFDFTAQHQHSSQCLWVGTKGTDYKLQSQEIAKSLGQEIHKFLTTQFEKYPALPHHIEPLIPTAESSLPVPLARLQEVPPLLHGTRLMTESLRIWQLAGLEDRRAFFTTAQEELKGNGWQAQNENDRSGSNPYVRYAKGQERLEIFIERRDPMAFTSTTPPLHHDKPDSPPAGPAVIVVHTLWTAPESVTPFLTKALEQRELDTVLMLKSWYWNQEPLRPLFEAFLDDFQSMNPAWMMEIATHWQRKNDPRKQWTALKKAHYLYQALGDSSHSSSINNTLDKIKEENPAFQAPPVDHAFLNSLGMKELESGQPTVIEKEVGHNEPVMVYALKEEGEPEIVSAAVLASSADTNQTFRLCTFGPQGSMATSISGAQTSSAGVPEWVLTGEAFGQRVNATAHRRNDTTFTIQMTIQ